jgi:hypothetical protein
MPSKLIPLAILAVLSMAGTHPAASAPQRTGGDLLRFCSTRNSAQDAGFCRGYIQAMTDAISDSPELGCLPDIQPIDHLTEVVVDYLNTYPEMRSYPAYVVVADALTRAYPCRQTLSPRENSAPTERPPARLP